MLVAGTWCLACNHLVEERPWDQPDFPLRDTLTRIRVRVHREHSHKLAAACSNWEGNREREREKRRKKGERENIENNDDNTRRGRIRLLALLFVRKTL